ncbi:MAG: alpha/beta hydrolase [Eubacteriales bacterium]|nr:alpha/beta hydrolase [Eubacteriales bacterium]
MPDSIAYRPMDEHYGVAKKDFMRWVRLHTPMLREVPPAVVRVKRKCLDVPYTRKDAPRAKLDLYWPKEGEGPFPVAVFLHGGAWMTCQRRDLQIYLALRALGRGFAVASVGYTLTDEAEHPTQLCEVKTAIRFLRSHADEYMLDAGRMALMGDSAGGHLASLAAVTAHVAELDDPTLGWPGVDSSVSAVVDWFGPIDLSTMDKQFAQSGVNSLLMPWSAIHSPASFLLGEAPPYCPEKVRTANPESFVDASCPPFYILHGTADQIVPCGQSIHFAKVLRDAIGEEKVTLELMEGKAHGDLAFFTPAAQDRVLDFLEKWV